MEHDLVHGESLLDLLTKQQTRGEPGVRLSFHQDLMSPVSFSLSPLHYAAVTGNTALVCYLYSEHSGKFGNGRNITVASFSAGGRNGQTPWRTPTEISPSVAASLAGHAITAKALKYFESGIPLHWNRKQNDKFKINKFKVKSQELMLALLESDWFYALPGPARVRLTDQLMTNLARVHVWNFLDQKIWDGDWKELLGEDILTALQEYNTMSPERAAQSRNHRYPPQYQFSVGQVNDQVRRRRCFREVCKFVRRGVCGGLWWLLQRSDRGPSLMVTVGMFAVTGYNDMCHMVLPLVLSIFRDPANP